MKLKERITQEQLDREVDIAKLSAEQHAKEASSGGLQATVGELGAVMFGSKWEKSLQDCIANGKAKNPNEDFYLESSLISNKMVTKTFQLVWWPRLTCPTPRYSQIVYKYCLKDDTVKFMWCLPTLEIAAAMLKNKEFIQPEDYDLLGYIMSYNDGSLDNLVKELNNEKELKTGLVVHID